VEPQRGEGREVGVRRVCCPFEARRFGVGPGREGRPVVGWRFRVVRCGWDDDARGHGVQVMARGGGNYGVFVCVLLFFARPEFWA